MSFRSAFDPSSVSFNLRQRAVRVGSLKMIVPGLKTHQTGPLMVLCNR